MSVFTATFAGITGTSSPTTRPLAWAIFLRDDATAPWKLAHWTAGSRRNADYVAQGFYARFHKVVPAVKLTADEAVLAFFAASPGFHTPAQVAKAAGLTALEARNVLGRLTRQGAIIDNWAAQDKGQAARYGAGDPFAEQVAL